MFVSFVMVAEMAEFAFPAWMRYVCLHSDGFRDGGICVVSAVRYLSILMFAEMSEYAFLARMRNVMFAF